MKINRRSWANEEKEKALTMKNEGLVNSQIALKLNRSESSISHFFSRNSLSLTKAERVNRRIRAVKNKKIEEVKEIIDNLKYDENLGYVIGALYGDGTVIIKNTRGLIKLAVKNRSFAQAFQNKIKKVFGIEPKFKEYIYKSTGKVYDVTLYKKYLAIWLNDNFGSFGERFWRINIEKFLNYGNQFCNGFVKGFFDAEGSIGKEKTPLKSVQFVSCNKVGLMEFSSLLATYGFEPKIFSKEKGAKWELCLSKRQSQLFAAIIGSEIDYKRERLNQLMNTRLSKGGWTDQEDKILNELTSQGKPAIEVAKTLARDKDAVYHRAKKLGIRFKSKDEWTKEKVIETLKEMYEKGIDLSPSNLRRSYGKLRGACEGHFGSIGKALKAATIPDNVLKRARKAPPKEELEQLYLNGRLSPKTIGGRYGVSNKVVLRWLKEHNIPIRSPHEKKISDELKSKVIQMYLSGISRDEIGKKFNCGRETIRKELLKARVLGK